MDWANRWFPCRACGQFIRSPWAFLDHKKDKCPSPNSTAGPSKELDSLTPCKQRPRSQVVSSVPNPASSKSEKKFKCGFCTFATNHRSYLKQHLQIHSTEKPFVCSLCNYACKTCGYLKKHSRCHAGETPFKCEDCEASFNTARSLGCHISLQHLVVEDENQPQSSKEKPNFDTITNAGAKRFQCQHCEHVTIAAAHLKVHLRIHTGVRPFACKLCNYAGKTSSALAAHRRSHAGETPFQCNECPARFNTRMSLARHFARQHEHDEYGPGETGLCYVRKASKGESKVCRFCSKVLKSVADRKIHERIHTNDRRFKCTECTADFIKKANLRKHMLTHGETKQFKCDLCKYSCHLKQGMILHVRSHTGEKPYKCSRCEAAFTDSRDLKRHLDVHNNIKNYKCNLCKYATNRMNRLKMHVRAVHMGERPYARKKVGNRKVHSHRHSGKKLYN